MDHGGKIIGMKHFLYVIAGALLFISSFNITAIFAEDIKTAPVNHIMVYYFHGNFRCTNCYHIEQYTKEAIEKYFQKELNAGTVVFKTINVEIKGNEHFTNDYQLYTKSVILSLVKNEREIKFDNLTKVWEYLRNKDAFHQYIKSEVEKYLKEL